ncbi:hypothetical protein [Spirosoma aerolatum]|uniref:hypothetical protein n=1 Tax=Spirosoma aerolatum TaxID=1211326 RepID=UPI0009ACB6BF|nr:hypothetical protein [Spirosoma aerolatum]
MKQTLPVLLMLSLIACNPLSKEYHKKTAKEDIEAIYKHDSIEGKHVFTALIKRNIADIPSEGIKYQQLADEGRMAEEKAAKQKKEEEEQAQKELIKEQQRAERLNKVFNLTLLHIDREKGDFQEYIAFKMLLQNRSDKEIKAVKGVITFNDLFDKEIKSINLTMDTPMKPGQSFNESYTIDYNQFIDEDRTLASKSASQVKMVWKPEKILFMDGTSIE